MEQQILLLTPGIRQKLKELASQDGRSISKFIEKLIDRTWRQQGGKRKQLKRDVIYSNVVKIIDRQQAKSGQV